MKLNLNVDLLMATATVILSILVYVDHCSARLRPTSSVSLSKVSNLAADHLSALQQTSRKVTKSSVVGINWKNVLVLAGIKAGLVGAGLIKKKVAYKKLKSLKSLSGLDHSNGLGYLNAYPLNNNFNPNSYYNNYDSKFTNSKFTQPPYFFNNNPSSIYPSSSIQDNWSKLQTPTPRSIDKNLIEQPYSPAIWRKSSLCNDLNQCADYLTSSSITYQLLGTSLPMHSIPVLLPASPPTTKLTSTKLSPSSQPSNQQPFVLTWVKSPSPSISSHNEIGNIANTNNEFSTNPKITVNNLNNLLPLAPSSPTKQIIVQEKEDDKYHHLNHLDPHLDQQQNYSTQFNASQYNTIEYKDNLRYKDAEAPSEQLIENSNKIEWS